MPSLILRSRKWVRSTKYWVVVKIKISEVEIMFCDQKKHFVN